MGKLSSVDYGYKEVGHCDKCGMEPKAGCCNTEFKIVKLQDSHQWSNQADLIKNFSIQEVYPLSPFAFSVRSYNTFNATAYHSPPDKRLNELYLHTTTLRI
jgi:hypothetical protein